MPTAVIRGVRRAAAAGVASLIAREAAYGSGSPTPQPSAEVAAEEESGSDDEATSPARLPVALQRFGSINERMPAAQQRTYARIQTPGNATTGFKKGDLVRLAVPNDLRGSIDPPTLLCRIIRRHDAGRAATRYTLICASGTLEGEYRGDDLQPVAQGAAATADVAAIPFDTADRTWVRNTITLAAAARAQS